MSEQQQPLSNDPTHSSSQPIESPPKPESIPTHPPPRKTIIFLSMLAIFIVAAEVVRIKGVVLPLPEPGSSLPRATRVSTYSASDYMTWLKQETQKWNTQGYQISQAFVWDDGYAISLTLVHSNVNSDDHLCKAMASDYIAQFHQDVIIHFYDGSNEYTIASFCTGKP